MESFDFEVPKVNARGEVVERSRHQAQQSSEVLAGGILLEMVFIPGGLFSMGTSAHYGYADERPRHPVSVAPFQLGKYLVTQEQWQAVIGKRPACRFSGPRLPVDRVSWQDACAFCRKLELKTGRAYRLPAEAEWEYACRANTASPFSYGETLTTDLANYVGEHRFAGEPAGIYRHCTTEVGSFPPNAFGLYDMHGNLWEWCADTWHEDYTGAPADSGVWPGQDTGERVVRGGSWHETPNHCRSAVRLKFRAAERDDVLGFRVALSV